MKFKKLGDFAYIKGRIGWKGLKKKEYLSNSDYRIINGSNIVSGKIDWTDTGYIDKYRYDESPEIRLEQDDILITKDGTIGKIAKVNNLNKPTTIASGLFLLRNKDNDHWDTDYLYWFLNSMKFTEFIHARTEGSVIPHLYQKDFEELQIPEISIDEQKKISKKLNTIQKKIELNNNINDNLLKVCKNVWNDFFFQNINLPGTVNISDFGEIISGGTPSKKIEEYYTNGDIKWVTPKDLSNNKSLFISKGKLNITNEGLLNSAAKILPSNSILFSSRAPIGYLAISKNKISTNQGFKSVVPKDSLYLEFLFFLMAHLTPQILAVAGGSTFKEISMAGLKSITFGNVNDSDILQFHQLSHPMFEQIRQLESENELLNSVKNKLLNGI